MVVVFVVDHFNSKSDGTCITAQRFEQELIRQGHTVRVVAYDVNGENRFSLKERRIPIVSNVAQKQNVYFAQYDEQVLRSALTGADVVHIFLPLKLGRKTQKLAAQMNIPATAAFHLHPQNITKNCGIRLPKFVDKSIFWYWRKSFYDKIAHIHCPTQFATEELKKHDYHAAFHQISNGITDVFRPSGERESFEFGTDRKFKILMVGRFAGEKRQDLLIEAVKRSEYNEVIDLTFAGKGGKLNALKRQAKSLPNNATFKFMTQEELLAEIRTADLYIHAADIEIEGMSCMEAFACGLVPVISNAENSATKQYVLDERCIFKAGNPDSLRQKIEYWLTHPQELNEMGTKYAEYAKNLSIQKSATQMVEMFSQAILDYKNQKIRA